MIEKYDITLNPRETLKSTWKKHVKQKITEKTEEEIREKCCKSRKSRFVCEDKYETKAYLLSNASLDVTKKILRARLNMTQIPANYKGKKEGTCPLCSENKNEKEGTTEHYFECKVSKQLAGIWKVKIDDLKSTDVAQLKNVANFLEKTEILLQSEWPMQSNQSPK